MNSIITGTRNNIEGFILEQLDNILVPFDFEDYKISVADQHILKSEHYNFIKKEVEGKISVDSVYFSGNYASVYFKGITNFNKENLKEICLLHKQIWNQRKVPFLYVSTPTEIRIYNCFAEPIDPNKDLDQFNQIELKRYSLSDTEEDINNMLALFSRIAIDSGTFWQNDIIISKFDVKKRVDNVLVQNLKDAKEKLRKSRVPDSIIHDLLTRSLFILYLEDIKATDKKFYSKFKDNSVSFFHLLTDRDATFNFFKHLEKKFNGNLFRITETEEKAITNKELSIISSCFWGDEVGTGQLSLWKKFDFSVIPIELLSEIYEIFLNKTKKEKANQGEYYTPHSLVDLILNESLPWANDKNQDYELKILDVACGSGIFLVESYRRLVDRWIYKNKQQPGFTELEKILLDSIFGFEINKEAIKVASFSLYLALISYLDPKTIWQKDEIKFPYLIYEPENAGNECQGKNLFRLSSLSNIIEHVPSFDLVVGNPPFKSAKTGSIDREAGEYCKKYGFAQEMVLPFLHRASRFCGTTGKVAIISTSKILFNKSGGYRKFREFLFEKENYVETVLNFSALRRPKKGQGKNIFSDAIGPACVLFFRSSFPEKQGNIITYVCPKPTERDQFSDDLVLDALDFYYLPRNECRKPDTIIWKAAMWGTENDFQLINNLLGKKSLNYYLTEKNGWYKGEGLQFLSKKEKKHWTDRELSSMKVVEATNVQRYYTPLKLVSINQSLSQKNIPFYLNLYGSKSFDELPEIDIFRMIGKKETYFAPHLLIKRGQSKKQFCASYLEYDCCFKHAIYGLAFKKDNITSAELAFKETILKSLTAYFNSKFSSYFLFLTTISWGVEREEVSPNEMLLLPALPFKMPEEQIKILAQKVDEISNELAKDFKNEMIISAIENEIDEIIYTALNLTQRERYLIEDIINYSLDLFQEGERSLANSPVKTDNQELLNYLEILCEDINEHVQFSETSVWASIWEMPASNHMRLVALHFTKEHKAGHIHSFPNNGEINNLIRQIDRYSYEKHSISVYLRKVLKYYSGDIIYIIKPNQKRFWSRSQAMQDSNSILLEISNMAKA